jgi:thiosulfate dehydrogenase (quinone) large subunit
MTLITPTARFFTDTRTAPLWLLLRLWLGYEWLKAGIEKFTGSGWVGASAGQAINGFFDGAIKSSQGEKATVTGWYAAVIENVAQPAAGLLTYLIPLAEVAVGALLIVGLWTGLAALIGALLNLNFLLAGTLGLNPLMIAFALLLVAAWTVAGWWGVDGALMRRRGTEPVPVRT